MCTTCTICICVTIPCIQLHGLPLPSRMSPPCSQSSQCTESNSYTVQILLVEQRMAPPQPHQITEENISPSASSLKEDLQSEYRRWWMDHLHSSTNCPKLDSYRCFHPSFQTAQYLNQGHPHLGPQAICFHCSNHRLDIELGCHNNIPKQDRLCRFCKSGSIGDEYHAFVCPQFLDLQVYCSINISTRPQFLTAMQDFPTNIQRYITLLMSRIRNR